MSKSIEEAIKAIRSGDKEKGKQILINILKKDSNNEVAWLWMTKVVNSNSDRIKCLENVLRINPNNEIAKQGMKKLKTRRTKGELESKQKMKEEEKDSSSSNKKKKKRKPIVTILALLGLLVLICICSGTILDQFETTTTQSDTQIPSVKKTPDDLLELLAMNDEREYDYITINGQVKNISGVKLDAVEAVANFYDSEDNFVKSDSALIKYDPILPGQISPFSVIATDNPEIKRYSVTFKFLLGGTIRTKDSR